MGLGKQNHDEDDDEKVRKGDDDLQRQLEVFVDGRDMTIVMTLLTVFALWGDDIRVAACPKWSDPIFYAIFLFSLGMFLMEFVINAIVKKGYKYSFFFWLDFIASVSIAPDIKWIVDVIGMITSSGGGGRTGAVSGLGGTRTARAARLVRLIRLMRIVKLYSMVRKAKDAEGEEKLKAQARAAANAKQAALKRVEASRLGKVLSEMTTRRVVIGVLLMLFVLPNLSYQEVDNSKLWGLAQMLWLGRSDCEQAVKDSPAHAAFHCDRQKEPVWASQEGWRSMVYLYSQVARNRASGNPPHQKLLWLHVTDFSQNSVIRDIESVYSPFGNWSQTDECAGLLYDDGRCPYRDTEMELVAYSPWECTNNEDTSLPCSEVRIFARFEKLTSVQKMAVNNIMKTLFVCVLLGTLAVQFENDTRDLVIAPIEKMVNIIKQLAEDPLKKPNVSIVDQQMNEVAKKNKPGSTGEGPQLETAMLETTILKIGSLLQVGFGEAGAEIIGRSMSSGDGELNIMQPGLRVSAVFGYVEVQQFAATIECLQEEIMVFVNKIAGLLHNCVHRWSGLANQNIGDSFLVFWKLPDAEPVPGRGNSQGDIALRKANIADQALLAYIKFVAEMQRSQDLQDFKNNPALLERFGEYEIKVGMSLHVGWAVEGPIGSDYKVDAAYLSPEVRVVTALGGLTKIYEVPIIMSERIYMLVSLRTKERIRKIDCVSFHGKSTGIFTYSLKGKAPKAPEGHSVAEVIKVDGLDVAADAIEKDGVEYIYLVDQDVAQLQAQISEEMLVQFRHGLCAYCAGDWAEARSYMEKAQELDDDGPTRALLKFMAMYDFEPPSEWDGCREFLG